MDLATAVLDLPSVELANLLSMPAVDDGNGDPHLLAVTPGTNIGAPTVRSRENQAEPGAARGWLVAVDFTRLNRAEPRDRAAG